MTCEHDTEAIDYPIYDYETEYEEAARHYETLREPEAPLCHPDFQPGEIVIARRFARPSCTVEVLYREMYNNPTGIGPADSAVYRVRSNTEDFSINGILLERG